MIVGTGTPETAWTRWSELRRFPDLDLRACTRLLVVAPHPDDEVLGVGGISAMLGSRGCSQAVLALTDGEASHPGSTFDRVELAERRAHETAEALRTLLGSQPQIERLRLPDGGLSGAEARLQGEISSRLELDTWCLAPFRHDGHPDHEAAGRAAARACRERGARLLEYPIWMWHWASPADRRVPWNRARCVRLSSLVMARKASAITKFRSQIERLDDRPGGEAILPPSIRERFTRSFEVVFE